MCKNFLYLSKSNYICFLCDELYKKIHIFTKDNFNDPLVYGGLLQSVIDFNTNDDMCVGCNPTHNDNLDSMYEYISTIVEEKLKHIDYEDLEKNILYGIDVKYNDNEIYMEICRSIEDYASFNINSIYEMVDYERDYEQLIQDEVSSFNKKIMEEIFNM